jgi:hypothetical protein
VEEEEEEMGLEKDMEDNVTIVTYLVILRKIVEIKCMIWKIKVPILVEETRNEKLFISSLMAHNEESEAWYIDLGCSTHMTSQEELFTRIDDNYSSKVIFGDDSASEVKGKGTMVILTLNGKNNFIDDTLLTPTLKNNLLFVG